MSTATFLKSDTTTQGTWYNGTTTVYGADGYGIIGNASSSSGTDIPYNQGYFNYPAYATVTVPSSTPAHCWANSATDVRMLEYAPAGTSNGSDSKRIEAAWYSPGNFTIDIQDGEFAHQIAIYFCDFDGYGGGRSEKIQITDDNNGNAVLDTRSISSFGNGIWLVWSVSGKVTFTITNLNSNSNAVVSGIFFDPAAAVAVAVFPPLVSRPRFEPAHYE